MSDNFSSLDVPASFDLEAGTVATGYNNVRIPGDQGTFFSMKDDLAPKTEFFYRIRVNYTIKNRHTLSVLYAPLELNPVGIPPMIFFLKE
jgi:hypothetical protein